MCDFCADVGEKGVIYTYQTVIVTPVDENDKPLAPFDIDMGSEWYACPTCAEFVDAKEWEALLIRVKESFIQKMGFSPSPASINTLRHLYNTMGRLSFKREEVGQE